MDSKNNFGKDIPKTSEKTEIMSVCSCNECDTLRCYLTKTPTTNTDDLTKTCIYVTNITIKQSSSDADTSTTNITTSGTINKREPSCEICKKDKDIKHNIKHNVTQPVRETRNSVCKICKKAYIDINDIVGRKRKHANIGDANQVQGSTNKTDIGKSSTVSDSINKNGPEYCKVATNEGNTNIINKSPPVNIEKKRKSECEICKQNIKCVVHNEDLVSNQTSILDTITVRNSVCEVCLRNINKLNNNVLKKDMVSEAFRTNNDVYKKTQEPMLLLNKRPSKPKCLINVQPVCSICAIKYSEIPRENLSDKKTPCKHDILIDGDTKCTLCRRDNHITRHVEKTNNRKSPQSITVDNESLRKKENHCVKSKCKLCGRDNNAKGTIDTAKSDHFETILQAELKPTEFNCQCGKDSETFHKTDKTDFLNNEIGAKYSKNRVPRDKRTPIQSGRSLILCTCKNHENLKKTNFAGESQVLNVHNATVNYTRKDINPSAAKLSAQIMDVPYEEFEESFMYGNQDNLNTRAKMKNNFSDEIIKRIKEVYRACSCKICECISGKSFKLDSVCNCKPCDCDNCRSYKNVDLLAEFRDESKLSYANTNDPMEVYFGAPGKKNNQHCNCTPCECIQCTPAKTFIAARVSENRQINNCTCTQCHCRDCQRNFFSMSTNLTHEMSTGMVRNCGCDQCVDQRCRGAGGTEDCRCEMPSKAIYKPVEKDSREYDIRHASVYHSRYNKKSDQYNTIALYASVSSNFPTLGTLEETCSCEECECIACKNDGKLRLKTILKPQPESYRQSFTINDCICESCECEVCSSKKNITNYDVRYQNAECTCGECDCINCPRMNTSSTNIKVGNRAKPIGKIYNKNRFSYDIQECDDSYPTGSSHTYGKRQDQHVCMNATLDKNCFLKNNFYDQVHRFNSNKNPILQCQDRKDKKRPLCDFSIYADNLHNNSSIKARHFNEELNYYNYIDKVNIDQQNETLQANIEKTTHKYENNYGKDSDYSDVSLFGTDKGHFLQNDNFFMSNCQKTYSSQTTLASCLKDILSFNEDLNTNTFKVIHDANNPNTVYNTHTYKYHDKLGNGRGIESSSNLHRKHMQIPTTTKVYNKNIPNDFILDMPLVVNSNKFDFSKNQIDYERVHRTLKEAKDFSEQLIKLLEKYERANKDLQSVSEKLKLSHGLNVISKLGTVQFKYVMVDKPNNEHDNKSRNSETEESNGKMYIETKSCSHHVPINNLRDEMIETDKSTQRKKSKESNFDISNRGDNMQAESKMIKDIETKEISGSFLITTKDNIIKQEKTLLQPNLDGNSIESIPNSNNIDNIMANIEEKINENEKSQLKEFNTINLTDLALHNTEETTLQVNPQNRIDNLTDQLSEMIKEKVLKSYEQILLTRDIRKYDKINVSENLDGVRKTQGKEINECYEDWSISKKNFHYINNQNIKDSFTLPLVVPKLEMQSISIQTSIEKHIDKSNIEVIVVKSASSLLRSKTIQVEKECDTRFRDMEDKVLWEKHVQRKSSMNSLMKSKTELDSKQQAMYNVAHSSRICELTRSKCSCEDLKVGSLSGRRVSDHTVMVKWTKPKEQNGVQGYELLVDGRPVQKIIDSARCMAVVTCLPNCEKVLLTMRTVLEVPLRSGHKPTVTIIYRPRSKKNRNEETY